MHYTTPSYVMQITKITILTVDRPKDKDPWRLSQLTRSLLQCYCNVIRQTSSQVLVGFIKCNEIKWMGFYATFVYIWAKLGQKNLLGMVIWMRWHCPPDTWFEIEPCWSAAKHVISRSCRLPTIFNLYDWGGRKHFILQNLECQSRRRICYLWLSKQAPGPRSLVLLLHTMADQECARGGGVSHILSEKRLLASLY